MDEEFSLDRVAGDKNSSLDIVFVHGLTGDPYQTWSSKDSDEFWPNWLQEDLPTTAIYTLGYPASIFSKWAKKELDIFERAKASLELLSAHGLGSRSLVFVAHSLGGILVKLILRSSADANDTNWNKIAESTRQVYFVATPHKGAGLAGAFKSLSSIFSSSHVKLLSNDTGVLDNLNDWYRSFSNPRSNLVTISYFEKYATKKALVVVDKETADPGVDGTPSIGLDEDHISISKPYSKHAILYLSIRMRLENLLAELQSSEEKFASNTSNDRYSTRHGTDRRDLYTKFLDADREHEYMFANNYQNEFARDYIKLGLFNTSKGNHDDLLAEVEQRFITHVYHPLICKGANDNAIRNALQAKVINPISKRLFSNEKFDTKKVLSAVYYLTEQCHIRWDSHK